MNEGNLLWDFWRDHARRQPGATAFVHWSLNAEPKSITWGELVATAWSYARQLREQGVGPGQVCAIILRHNPEFYPLYLAVSFTGAIPSVLAYPNPRLHPDKFRQGLEGMACCSGLDLLLTESDLQPLLQPLVDRVGSSIRRMLFPLDWADCRPEVFDEDAFERDYQQMCDEVDTDAPCLLQHSSGTTGLQKGVMLSHRAVVRHLRDYGGVLGVGPRDSVVSWLPLYHDMGLIAAFHLPIHFGLPVVQIDPFEWVTAPVLLPQLVSRYRATMAWLPNFAYNLMADRCHEEDLEGVRLDSLRLLVNCSEPVRQESHARFVERFAAYGLSPAALSASYAMAETTFAATQTEPGQAPRVVEADWRELSRGHYRPAAGGVNARKCVSSGRAIPGCRVRVVGEQGADLADGQVGELLLASASLFDGYRNNPTKTAEALQDGWYRSGDLGFLLDGECFVIGRKKDIIIVAGKNLYPEDIEATVGEVPGVLPGRVVAFGQDNVKLGTEEVWVIAETAETDPARLRGLDLAVKRAGMEINVTISRVALVPPRWLFKSSSGKPMRKANQERLAQERLAA